MTAVHRERPDHARELRFALTDATELCERLGLIAGRGSFLRQAGGVIIRCPWHEERTPSCSVRRASDGTIAARCHGCGATGDALSLVAVANGLNTTSDFRQVLRVAAKLAGQWSIVQELDTGERTEIRTPIAPPPPQPERTYPPKSEVDRLWSECTPVEADDDASRYLRGRAIDPEMVAGFDLARAIPAACRLPRWAAYQREPWTKTGHRIVVPMRSSNGSIVSIRAIRVADGESPKRLPPGGHKATALVMADEIGVAMLTGSIRPARVVVTEGEPDFLVWATRARTGAVTAVLGIVTGSWTSELAERIAVGTEVIIRTDHDAAGDAYAKAVWSSLKHRCFVRRGGRG